MVMFRGNRASSSGSNDLVLHSRAQAGAAPGYCNRPSSSFTHSIFSETQLCSVGANAFRSSNVANATPATVPFLLQANSRVPQDLQNTRSSLSEEAKLPVSP